MCFFSVVTENYQHYIPWFIYFLEQSYPKAKIIIHLDGKLSDSTRKHISIFDNNYEIIENAFDHIKNLHLQKISTLRWLVFEKKFLKYDLLSIGDIDMAILLEEPSCMEQHLSHCKVINMPYSNFVRDEREAEKRLSGIHVVEPNEWFHKTQKARDTNIASIQKIKPEQISRGYNEKILYRIVTESFGECPPNISQTYVEQIVSSAHHGIHIRAAEKNLCSYVKSIKKPYIYKTQLIQHILTEKFKYLGQAYPDHGKLFIQIADIWRTINAN